MTKWAITRPELEAWSRDVLAKYQKLDIDLFLIRLRNAIKAAQE